MAHKRYPAPGACMVCGTQLTVTRLKCNHCETEISGKFENCSFCQLTPDQKEFIEVFIMSRGNIKEVERILGISYPTVRSRLEAISQALGLKALEPKVDPDKKREILVALDRGEMTTEEALKRLRGEGE